MEYWYPKGPGNAIIVVRWFGKAALCIETQDTRGIVTPKLMTKESLERWHTRVDVEPWFYDYPLDHWAFDCAE